MAKRSKIGIMDEIRRLSEEEKIRIVIGDNLREILSEVNRYTWKTGKEEECLEARAGEDGIFRVEADPESPPDPWGELERLREKLREQESQIGRFILGKWEE